MVGIIDGRESRSKKREMSARKRHNYKNLKIWSLGMEIVDDIFEILKVFPTDERFGLISQIVGVQFLFLVTLPKGLLEPINRSLISLIFL